MVCKVDGLGREWDALGKIMRQQSTRHLIETAATSGIEERPHGKAQQPRLLDSYVQRPVDVQHVGVRRRAGSTAQVENQHLTLRRRTPAEASDASISPKLTCLTATSERLALLPCKQENCRLRAWMIFYLCPRAGDCMLPRECGPSRHNRTLSRDRLRVYQRRRQAHPAPGRSA